MFTALGEDDPRFGNWQDFQEESEQKDLFGRGNAKRLAAMGNTRTSFPGMPKPGTRQSIVRAPTQITHK